jgi:hypothetical protein
MPNSRYDYTKSKKVNKKSVFKPTLYPKIPLRDDDIYIFSRESEKLEHISYRFYGTPEYWWVIAKANNISNGSIFLKPGRQLRIPQSTSIQEILNSLEELNSLY